MADSDEVYCSTASIWEMAIKLGLGKLKMSLPLEGSFEQLLEQNGFLLIPVAYAHAARVAALPWHHRDPFDRLLIAQAMVERMSLLSHDTQLDAYGVKRIWLGSFGITLHESRTGTPGACRSAARALRVPSTTIED